ncbi:MAG: hypothetical protein AB7O57_05800, partial [Hyphomicrobiaceae bacterium]
MTNAARTAEHFRNRGAAARRAHEAVTTAFATRLRERDPVAYDGLLRTFHAAVAAALPSSDPQFFANLARANPRFVEAAIAFLEADPRFFRSGYEKQMLIRHLKRIPLGDRQRERLGRVVLDAIDGKLWNGHLRHYARLACGVWTDALDAAVAERMTSLDLGVQKRATRVA